MDPLRGHPRGKRVILLSSPASRKIVLMLACSWQPELGQTAWRLAIAAQRCESSRNQRQKITCQADY